LKICLTGKYYCKIYEIKIEERNPLKQGLKPRGKKIGRLEGEKIRVKDLIAS